MADNPGQVIGTGEGGHQQGQRLNLRGRVGVPEHCVCFVVLVRQQLRGDVRIDLKRPVRRPGPERTVGVSLKRSPVRQGYAYRVVIQFVLSVEIRSAGVPGGFIEGDELDNGTIPVNDQVITHLTIRVVAPGRGGGSRSTRGVMYNQH